jgi:hypothetical protein
MLFLTATTAISRQYVASCQCARALGNAFLISVTTKDLRKIAQNASNESA